MKLKDFFSPVILIAVGAAFLIISLLIILSNGKNKKLIASKMRLGAFLLSFTWFLIGCDGITNTCYAPVDVVPYNEILINPKNMLDWNKNHYSIGDTISGGIYAPTYASYAYALVDSVSKQTKQSGDLSIDSTIKTTINTTEYFHIILDSMINKGTYNLNYIGIDSLSNKIALSNEMITIYIK